MKILFSKILILSMFLFVGCSGSDDGDSGDANAGDDNKVTSLQIFISADEVIIGNSVLFSVFDNNGKNRTSEANFYVNEIEIAGSSHIFNDLGTFEVYAKFQNVTSQTKVIIVNPVPIEYKQFVLIEDYTGTWCGWCPRVSYAIEEVKKQTNDAVIIALHQGSSDPMAFSQINLMLSTFGVTGFPTALIDRSARWAYPEPNNISQVTGKLTKKSYAALAMESSINGNELTVKLKLKMGYNFSSLRLGLYITEDGILHDQVNFTQDYYGNGVVNPLKNFEHNNVLRKSITNVLGDLVPEEQTGHDKEYEKEYTYTIPSQYDIEKLKLIAFVTEGDSKETINVRASEIGENQNFEK